MFRIGKPIETESTLAVPLGDGEIGVTGKNIFLRFEIFSNQLCECGHISVKIGKPLDCTLPMGECM